MNIQQLSLSEQLETIKIMEGMARHEANLLWTAQVDVGRGTLGYSFTDKVHLSFENPLPSCLEANFFAKRSTSQ